MMLKLLVLLLSITLYVNAYDVYRDETASLSIEEIVSKKDQFISRDNLNFGYTSDVIWIKYNLKNLSKTSKKQTLLLSPIVAHVSFYKTTENGFEIESNGYLTPIKNKTHLTRNLYFQTTLKSGESQEIFIKVYSKTPLMLTLNEFSELDQFYKYTFNNDLISIALISILIAFIIYNIFIYYFTRDRIYLYYLIYQAITIVFQLYFTAFSTVLIDSGEYYSDILILSSSMMYIAIFFFFKEILELKTKFPKLHNFYMLYVLLFVITCIIALIYNPFVLIFRNAILVPIGLLVVTFTLIYAMLKKIQLAKYLFVGWVGYFFSLIYTALHFSIGLPDNFISVHGILVATIVEVVVFSIILAMRFHNLQDEVLAKDDILQIKSKDAQMGEMIGIIAHQWKQPLTAIGAGAIAQKIKLDLNKLDLDSLKDYLNSIDKTVAFLSETIDDFRTFAKAKSKLQLTTIRKPIEKALNILNSIIISRNIALKRECNSAQNIKLHVNEVTQVVMAIIKNSIDNFVEKNIKNPEVLITTEDIDSIIQIKISDNGGGIPESIIENIFEHSFTTKTDESGTGLGLHMVRRIIHEHHNGEIRVENLDDGVCFTIDLPV